MAERAAVAWPAPAKLNLFLHVTGRRADGYHELQTLFQILDWGDEVRIRPDRSGRLRRIGADYGVPEDDDLALRAARRRSGTRLADSRAGWAILQPKRRTHS